MVITSRTRNAVVRKGSWVRIPPLPPACVDEKDAGEKATLKCGFFSYSATIQAEIEEKGQVFQKQGA